MKSGLVSPFKMYLQATTAMLKPALVIKGLQTPGKKKLPAKNKPNSSASLTKKKPKSPATKAKSTTKPSATTKLAAGGEAAVAQIQAKLVDGVHKVDRTTLVKQKVKSYPRDRLHFFNRVVQAKKPSSAGGP